MIAIVDYDVGNVGSVLNMLHKVGAKAEITRDHDLLRRAEKLVLPGVGAFDDAMSNLHRFGLFDLLNELVLDKHKPVLGVCLGAQLVARRSEEGERPGFGWIDADIVRFRSTPQALLRVPHMGWNVVSPTRSGISLFQDIPEPMRFYFVHSFHMKPASADLALGETDYGYRFVSAIGRANIVATQWHPEKSHKYGLQLYRNFSERFETC